MIFCISVVSVVTFLSFLIIFESSLFFLHGLSLAKGLSYLSFKKAMS